MKGFLYFSLTVLVIYSIYYDLQFGTIPLQTKAATVSSHVQAHQSNSQPAIKQMPHQNRQVRPGDTVLSIIEKINGNASVSIQKMVRDFDKLNPGVDANEIKIGHTYSFPVYK